MCALFGPRVSLRRAELLTDPPHIWPEPLDLTPGLHSAPLLAATIRLGPLGETRATVQRGEAGLLSASSRTLQAPLTVLGHAVRLPPLAISGRRLDGLDLGGAVHTAALSPRVRVRRDLEAARRQLVQRRGIPPRLLTEAQASYWRKRLGDAKRVSPRLVELVALFPDVPIVGDAPVQFSHGALSYPLPEKPVPLTTVVIAKHQASGELLIGRFARG